MIGLGATITAIAPAAAQAIPDAGFIRQTLVPGAVADSGSGQRVSGSAWMNDPNQMPKSAEGTAGDHLNWTAGSFAELARSAWPDPAPTVPASLCGRLGRSFA